MSTFQTRFPQYVAALLVNVLSFVYGLAIGWTAPMQPLLQGNFTETNETSPLGTNAAPLTDEDISWLGGGMNVAGFVGTPIMGLVAERWGSRSTHVISVFSFITSFSLAAAASNKIMVIVSRVFAGIGAAGNCVMAPIYVGETVQNEVRGTLASFRSLFLALGTLISYIVGSYTSYMNLTLFCLCWSILFLLLMWWLPESPIFLIQHDKSQDAYKSLLKLRGNQHAVADNEICAMSAKVKEIQAREEGAMTYKQMLCDQPTRRALFIALSVLTFQHCSGISPILNHTVFLFNASGSPISSTSSTIIIGALQVVGNFTGTALMEYAGRRVLLLVSSVGMAVTLAPLSYFFYHKSAELDACILEKMEWLPITCLSLYVILYCVGYGAVPFVLISELFKTEANSLGISICVMYSWAVLFLVVKLFTTVHNAIGIHSCFIIYCISSLCSAVFVGVFVIETQGKSRDEIVAQLTENNKTETESTINNNTINAIKVVV